MSDFSTLTVTDGSSIDGNFADVNVCVRSRLWARGWFAK